MKKIELGIEILKILNEHNFEAYIVGGAVRDFLLDIEPNDIDITTNASVDEIAMIFENVDLRNKKYLNCKVFYKDLEFEITTYRYDVSYNDHRHPVVGVANSLEEDLARRDFTINAMAMNKDYNVIDLFGGRNDLNQKLIKVIGDPNVRFDEDGLRVLRAIYYATKLDFSLDSRILESFDKNFIEDIPSQYIKQMVESICGNNNFYGTRILFEYNVLRSFSFFNEVVNLCYKYRCNKYFYALYYCEHSSLESNEIISNIERKFAKRCADLVLSNFSKLSLYYSELELIKPAVYLYNLLNSGQVTEEAIYHKYKMLAIHSSKEIKYNIMLLPEESRSKAIKAIEYAIIEKGLLNNPLDIDVFVKKEVL